jgi:hypothetical protein
MKLWIYLLVLLPVFAEAKPKRKPANNTNPAKVLTFQCHEEESGDLAALGVAHMSLDLRDSTTGSFSMSFYLKTGKTFSSKTLIGTFTTVPEGFVYRTQWNPNSNYTLIHLHPADKTSVPGKKEKMACEVNASIESYP